MGKLKFVLYHFPSLRTQLICVSGPASHIQQSSSVSKLTPKSCVSTPKESQQPIQKNPISTLQEYSQQRKTQPPLYDIHQVENGSGFYCRIMLEGKMYLGSIRPGKKEAKQSAAEKAIEIHISTSTSNDTLPSSEVISYNIYNYATLYLLLRFP